MVAFTFAEGCNTIADGDLFVRNTLRFRFWGPCTAFVRIVFFHGVGHKQTLEYDTISISFGHIIFLAMDSIGCLYGAINRSSYGQLAHFGLRS